MNETKLYRKRPLVVKARQLTADMDVDTLEGTMQGHAGDYFVIGVKGEKYIVRQDIFEATYVLEDDDKA